MTTSVRDVPNVERTPRRTVRVPDELWQAAQRVAAARDESVTDVVNRALEAYVRRHAASSSQSDSPSTGSSSAPAADSSSSTG